MALARLDQLIARDSNRVDAYLMRGQILASQGNLPAAIDAVEHAVTAHPENAQTYGVLGWLHFLAGHLAEAEQATRQAIAIDPARV
ncbi:MAG: hypothetical protein FD149_2692 [Rhodospirillaceae bacterium]|nr:MAG: hypothetical protein FD149_2692 [Rhodospirillaceae bacterium]